MNRKRVVRGIIIGRKNFGELDRAVVIFTEKEGKIWTLAKGIRKINSRRAGSLELGNQVKALIHKGKTFDILIEVEVIDNFNIRSDPTRTGGMLFLCELVNTLLPEKENNGEIYQEFSKERNLIKNGKIESIVFFEAKLLKLLGYGFNKKIKEFLKERKLKEAHKQLKRQIETIAERPLKTLAIFN